MLRSLLISIVLFCFIGSYAQAPTAGLVAYWPMNGNYTDAGPNGINGTNSGSTASTNVFATANTAMAFSNPGSPVVQFATHPINANSSFGTNQDFSIDFSVFTSSQPHAGGIYDNNLNYGGPGVFMWNANGFQQLNFNFKNGNIGTTNGALPLNVWKHVCCVRSGTALKIYVNGVLNATGTPSTTAPVYSFPARFGTMFFNGFAPPEYNGHNGKIDEFRLYNRALSAAEIQQLSDLALLPPPSGPVMSASLTDALLVDVNSNTVANPGDQLQYTTVIRNTGVLDGNGVNLNLAAPTNTTLNPGSTVTSALARDDAFSTFINTSLNTGNVITNDYGLPSVSVVSFGTTASLGTTTAAGSAGTTNAGGTLTVNGNGTFNYLPPPAFSGTDQFMYIATTGVAGLPNNDAVVTITVYPDILFSTTNVNPACNGASTGSITFTGVSGGSGPVYTFSITGAGGTYFASNVFSGLAAATYNLAVKDGAGNIKTGTAVLTNPPLITFTHVDVNNTCGGGTAGSITFTASGGTGALTYSITGAGGTYFASPAFTGLAGGTYNLAVKDANGCIVTGTATLTDPPPVTFTFTKTDITCFGAANGSIVFNAPSGGTGPYTYSITGTGGSFTSTTNYTGLVANTYNLVVKDATGCNSATQTTTVAEPAAIVVSGTIPNLTYNVAMATATFTKTGGSGSPANPWSATGLPTGVSINTATGAVTGTPLQTGTFNAVITYSDANSCTGTKNVSFTVAPNLVNNSYNVVGNTQLVADGHSSPATTFSTNATNIITNDQADVAITITAVTNAATTGGGSITIDAAGKFTYSPPVGSTVADSYVYTGTANGISATATINFTIANMVWYVNKDYAGGSGASDGRSHRPYTDVASAEAASAINQIIYVHTGTGNTAGNALLKSGQTLRGAGSALTVGALSIAAGTKPTLTGMITLANSVTVDGFDMSTGATTAITSSGATGVTVNIGNVTTAGATNAVTLTNTTGTVSIAGGTQTGSTGSAFNINGGTVSMTYSGAITQAANAPMVNVSGGHITGTITFNTGALNATNGTGLQFDNADGTYNFNGPTTLNGGDAGIEIRNGSGGTFSFGNSCSITNPLSEILNINGSTANVTYSGTFLKNNNTFSGISINAESGGTININGTSTKTLSTGTGIPVFIVTNPGTTINFSGNNLSITTTSAIGFNATGGGTISVTGTGNTITSTTGTALNVANTTIGAAGLTFQSISSSGGANGIVLNNASGNLTVTGDGSGFANGSGGSLSNITGGVLGNAPVYMLSCSGTVTLKSMNMSLNTNCYSGMLVDNNASGNVTVNVIGCTFIGVTSSIVQNKSLLQFEAGGAANVTANVQNSYFSSNRTYGVFATGAGTSIVNITINQCGFGTDINTGSPVNNPGTMISNPPPFSVGVTNGSSSKVDYLISNNTFWGADGLLGAIYAVTISGASTTASSHLIGTFIGNKIGKAGVTGSGSSNGAGGLGLLNGTDGIFQASVLNNDIRQTNAVALNVFNSAGGGAVGTINVKIKGNTFAEPDVTGAPLFLRAIVVSPGNSGGANIATCAEIGGSTAGEKNDISGAWQAGNFIRVTNNNNTATIRLPGLIPAAGATAAQVNAFVQANNTLPASSVNTSLGVAGVIGGGICF